MTEINVVGGGLAGCEAAWQLANRGCRVILTEMRPLTMTPAHNSGDLAELVCSNSLGAENPDSPGGLLKAELRALNSLIMECADAARVPAGGALAVDRNKFAQLVTQNIRSPQYPGAAGMPDRFSPCAGHYSYRPSDPRQPGRGVAAKTGA